MKFESPNPYTNYHEGRVKENIDKKYLVFGITGGDKKNLDKFLAEHECEFIDNPFNAGAIGANLSFHFYPNSVGMGTTVKCNCGVEEDITDTSMW